MNKDDGNDIAALGSEISVGSSSTAEESHRGSGGELFGIRSDLNLHIELGWVFVPLVITGILNRIDSEIAGRLEFNFTEVEFGRLEKVPRNTAEAVPPNPRCAPCRIQTSLIHRLQTRSARQGRVTGNTRRVGKQRNRAPTVPQRWIELKSAVGTPSGRVKQQERNRRLDPLAERGSAEYAQSTYAKEAKVNASPSAEATIAESQGLQGVGFGNGRRRSPRRLGLNVLKQVGARNIQMMQKAGRRRPHASSECGGSLNMEVEHMCTWELCSIAAASSACTNVRQSAKAARSERDAQSYGKGDRFRHIIEVEHHWESPRRLPRRVDVTSTVEAGEKFESETDRRR
ncbi:hypothetical protein B0H16DRAFT_1462293 [Mycena metata]|uniref:Uncharacterized protein n=1 Tax=Mycena metata TaxID=1033252 RepID=A0AAD7IPX5_9AGAR|nr:hypothetical protein B0H16DRAFT_1462293 [Mycena metata]